MVDSGCPWPLCQSPPRHGAFYGKTVFFCCCEHNFCCGLLCTKILVKEKEFPSSKIQKLRKWRRIFLVEFLWKISQTSGPPTLALSPPSPGALLGPKNFGGVWTTPAWRVRPRERLGPGTLGGEYPGNTQGNIWARTVQW